MVLALLAALGAAVGGCATAPAKKPAPPPVVKAPTQAKPPAPKWKPDVVALPAPTHPTVAFRILFRSGSVDDPPGREGVTALAANLMAEGGTREMTSAELLRALYPMAADLSVQSDREMTVFTGHVNKDHVARFLPLLLDVVTHPRWDEKEFERVRTDTVNDIERRLRTSDDEELGKAALGSLLYAGHPYGHLVEGTVRSLQALTLADLKAQAARVFTRARVVIGVAGGYPDGTIDRIEAGLLALPAGDPKVTSSVVPPAPAQSGPKVLIVEKKADSTAVSIGYPWELKRSDPDYPAMYVVQSAFGEHRQFNGRLMLRLREVRGLNYGDYAYIENFIQDGWGTFVLPNIARRHQFFSIWLRPVENKNRLFAIRAALYETQKLAEKGLTDEEVADARRFLAGYTYLQTQTDMRRLGFAMDDLYYGTPHHMDELRKGIGGLTTAEVNAAIRKWIDPSRLRVAIVTEDAEGLKKQMVSGAVSLPHYPAPMPKDVVAEDKVIEKLPLGLKDGDVRIVKASELFEGGPTPQADK